MVTATDSVQLFSAGLPYSEQELSKHCSVTVGSHRSTISRLTEINDGAAEAFFRQFEEVLGKG